MAGDIVTIATQAWYQGTVQPPPSGASNLLNDLLGALTGGVISNSHSLYSSTDNNPNSVLSGDLPQFFTHNEDSLYNTSAPKAFLNWVAFDNQLNMNAANSGVVQVPTITGSEQAQPLVAPEQIIQKDGYLYIYVSNESAQRVFFDNLVIHHNKGHLLEEDQYYPYGLKMAGISDQALPVVPNNYLYNGKELQQNEFSDGTGLEDYDYGFRGYDPQIARFTEQDPLTGNFATVSPYQYGLNDPVGNIDMNGLNAFSLLCPGTSGFSIFLKQIGEVASQIANSPVTRVISMTATSLRVAGIVSNTLAVGNEINNSFMAEGVGGVMNDGTDNANSEGINDEINLTPGPPTEWLKKILQFLGLFSQSNDPQARWEYAKRNAELNNLVNQNIQAQKKVDKYSSYIPVLGGAVKMSEGMQDDKPLEIMGGMGSIGFDLFGGEVLNGLGRGITVLGSYNEITGGYVGLAKKLGANFFEIPQSIWEKMTPTEQWSANVKFLDRAIARGDQIILSNSAFEAKAGTSFYKELKYLYLKGYKAASNGMSLIKP